MQQIKKCIEMTILLFFLLIDIALYLATYAYGRL